MLKRKKRVLLHGYDSDNLGDDLFFRLLVTRYSHVQFVMPTLNLKSKARFADLANLKIIDFRKIARFARDYTYVLPKLYSWLFMRCFDAVVYIGGSLFIDHREYSAQYQYVIENYSFLCDYKIAAKAKVPCYLLGANWGPSYHDYFYKFFNQAFDSMQDIFFRDKYSYEIFKSKPQVRFGGDILMGSSFISHAIPPVKKLKNQIAFSIIAAREDLNPDSEAYILEIIRICREFISAGYQVKLLSFCITEGDQKTAEKVIREIKCPPEQISHLAYTDNWQEMLITLAQSELVVASRFHAAVLGWTLNTKVFSLLYSQKTQNLLNDCNITDGSIWLNDIGKVTAEYMLEHAVLLQNPEKFSGERSAFKKLDQVLY